MKKQIGRIDYGMVSLPIYGERYQDDKRQVLTYTMYEWSWTYVHDGQKVEIFKQEKSV